jgi:hypothetical protein
MEYKLYIDIDYKYDLLRDPEFRKELNRKINETLKWLYGEPYAPVVTKILYRRSATGHIHLCFVLAFDETFFTYEILMMYILRAKMGDDAYRIYNDLRRTNHVYSVDSINRIFNKKIKDNKVYRAGEWKEWER